MAGSVRVLWPWPGGVDSTALGPPDGDVLLAASAAAGLHVVAVVVRFIAQRLEASERGSQTPPSRHRPRDSGCRRQAAARELRLRDLSVDASRDLAPTSVHAGHLVDELRLRSSLDHRPPAGADRRPDQPILEGWSVLAAWAARTAGQVRPLRRRQYVPVRHADGEAGHDARSHQCRTCHRRLGAGWHEREHAPMASTSGPGRVSASVGSTRPRPCFVGCSMVRP